jgi:hypothetical protein
VQEVVRAVTWASTEPCTPTLKIDRNHLVAVYPTPFWFQLSFLGYVSSRVFRSTLQGY